MHHLKTDILLKSALSLLDDHEEQRVRDHLRECSECSQQFTEIKGQTGQLGNLELDLPEPKIPFFVRPSQSRFPAMRTAAFLVIGFLAGLAASEFLFSYSIHVVGQHLESRPLVVSNTQFFSCEQIGTEVQVHFP